MSVPNKILLGDLTSAAQPLVKPVRWQEIIAVVLLVALSDLTIYRGHGFAGCSLFLFAAPFFLFLGSQQRTPTAWTLGCGIMLLVLAAKSLWLGSALLLVVGVLLTIAFTMTLSNFPPYIFELGVFAAQVFVAGYHGLMRYGRFLTGLPRIKPPNWINVGLPLVTLLAFSVLFVLANPDLLKSFSEGLSRFVSDLENWLAHYGPRPSEVIFWVAVLWVTIGLLRPMIHPSMFVQESDDVAVETGSLRDASPMYSAFRNTLITLILLFAVYLVFEFKTLWFRVFPKGFYYSGYAHEGAAWLTVALALATVILSLIFRGRMLRDVRLPSLRRWAWIWSLENMLLALAVYHRLLIYVGFNGMSRMRMIAFFGISTVVAGFILVLWKIAYRHDFLWLFRRHLWALALAIYLFAITPVDAIVVGYNARRILSGDPAPSVQISVHPIDAHGMTQLVRLLDCQDSLIREGVRAMLAEQQLQAEAAAVNNDKLGWTTYQIAERRLFRVLYANQRYWSDYRDERQRNMALQRFHTYAYQWY